MLERGVALAPGAYEIMFVSLAHSDSDLDRAIEAAREAAGVAASACSSWPHWRRVRPSALANGEAVVTLGFDANGLSESSTATTRDDAGRGVTSAICASGPGDRHGARSRERRALRVASRRLR
jgi:hypothetical protein